MYSAVSTVVSAPGSKKTSREQIVLSEVFLEEPKKMHLCIFLDALQKALVLLSSGILYLPLQDETPTSWSTSKEG